MDLDVFHDVTHDSFHRFPTEFDILRTGSDAKVGFLSQYSRFYVANVHLPSLDFYFG